MLQKPILSLVLEASGCRVSSDAVLNYIKNDDLIMVLSINEMWSAAIVINTSKEKRNQPMKDETIGQESITSGKL